MLYVINIIDHFNQERQQIPPFAHVSKTHFVFTLNIFNLVNLGGCTYALFFLTIHTFNSVFSDFIIYLSERFMVMIYRDIFDIYKCYISQALP